MDILRTVVELRHWSRGLREWSRALGLQAVTEGGNLLGLVPTMGALHAGHASLIRLARKSCGYVAVSIFVNPTQFGPTEDFARYPRAFDEDCALAHAEGATVVFAPAVEEMYPPGASTLVDVAGLSRRLDGASRPGHFQGVATVVAKLLIASEADCAFFGQKDAAQVAVIRRLAADLRLATRIVVCPIVRDHSGLALSSRNVYLDLAERIQARVLRQTLISVESLVAQGERRAQTLLAAAHQTFATVPEVRIDYIELVHPDTLLPVESAVPGTLLALAAYVGKTRLIDNTILP